VGDIDLATPLHPEAVMARLDRAGISCIATGLQHGTVTAVADGDSVEITTLRRDVETDGRHARVDFTDDWAADAARRDFTMNALYLDTGGGVWDPTGGLADCRAGRVRFVGDPATRIEEDRLRVLRFYRFQAHYGRETPDAAARAACRDAAGTLARLSGERVRTELMKLLAAPDPVPTVRFMAEDGVLGAILGSPLSFDRLAALLALERAIDPLRRLAALLPRDPTAAGALAGRLRFSNPERDRLTALADPAPAMDLDGSLAAQRRLLYVLGAAPYGDRILLAATAGSADRLRPLLAFADAWKPPTLPVAGADLLRLGIAEGPRVGEALRRVEAWWIERDFRPDRAACLVELERITREFDGGME
jgi:poly(A) polymerase